MQIGILGAGNMADALGAHWVRAGHEVTVSSRTAGRARALAGRIGARAGTWAQAAQADVVLLAISAEGVPDVLGAVDLRGKVLIDCTNAVVQGEWTLATPEMAMEVARLSGARVVKAFNLCPDETWRAGSVAVPVCGDDPAAVEAVKRLVVAAGCRPVEAGGLERAALLEATAVFVIGMAMGGTDPRLALG
jgi:8-hydroxy-5-deazaflavin:NADPH oxidoreductase